MEMHNAEVMRYQTAKFVQAMMSVHPELQPVPGLRIRRDHIAVPKPTRDDVDDDERAAKAAADAEKIEKIKLLPIVSMRILRTIEYLTGVSIAEMKGRSRLMPISTARQLAMWHLHKAGYGYSTIGRMLNVDHTTAIHAVRVLPGKAVKRPEIAKLMDITI